MTSAGISDLLEALGEVFLHPGADGQPSIGAVLECDWPSPALRSALLEMQGHRDPGLEVTYAGLFLVGAEGRPHPLEVSVLEGLRLRHPQSIDRVARVFAAAGVLPEATVSMDHLGAMSALLGFLLRRLWDPEDPDSPRLEQAARDLLRQDLLPLASHLDAALGDNPSHPFYRAAARALRLALERLEPVFP
ncbi:MAG: molecular chaperone TorD family protein [Acidobacteria bacterium]|nr:molecular chaperone TorD family protein [Acidobacteriota bacterium]